jgi:hypothetical protein
MSKHYCHQTPGLRCSLEGPGNTCTGGWLSAGHCANRKDYPPAAKSEQIINRTSDACHCCKHRQMCKYRESFELMVKELYPIVIHCQLYHERKIFE